MEEHKASYNGEKTVHYIPLESMDLFLDAEPMKTERIEPSSRSQDLLPNSPYETGFMRMPITSLRRISLRKPYVIVIVSLGFGRDLSFPYIEF